MLQMLEPITLPIAMSPWPESADEMLTNSSGDDVPQPMIVKPMMKLLSFAFFAIATEESTRTFAPTNSNARPTIRKM